MADVKKPTIHFIGLGGIGMSGIARMYLTLGYAVQGSDVKASSILSELSRLGIKTIVGHAPANVDGADLVVFSSSIRPEHPERAAAVKKGLRVLHRSEALAALCRGKYTIAVTGTHGKTTTTAMVGLVLKEARRDPSVVVGGIVELFGGNALAGKGGEMVIEADESDASFLNFSPDLEIITNIEKEHLDHYGTVERMEAAYRDFLLRMGANGKWIGCGEDACIARMARENVKPSVLYGFDRSFDFYAENVVECPDGGRGVSFDAFHRGKFLGRVKMQVLGRHNVLNALAAIAAAELRGVAFADVQAALAKFEGAGRRFDVKYESPDTLIVDDYAHHPTEIKKTLAAARAIGKNRIFAVFQPHRYSRTESLLREFADCFGDADKLFVTDIYAAGEKVLENVSGSSVCDAVRSSGHPDVLYVPRAELAKSVRSQMQPGDLVIAMGAGDIYQVASELSFFRGVRGPVVHEEPLSRHTSLKIGGPAEYFVEPEDLEDLKTVLWECRARGLRVRVIGAGSNVLAADEGVRGVVVHLGAPYFRQISFDGGRVTARAGVMNTLFIQACAEKGLGGFEFLSGIPGNVGGAVAMNAGSHGEAVSDCFEEALLLGLDGRVRRAKKAELGFGYRSSGVSGEIVVEAVFSFPAASPQAVQKKLDDYRDHRQKTQDLRHASAGCLFKNPESAGCSSGALIDRAGLKGFRVGGAQVSEKHANFMINAGGATAADARGLIAGVREKVRETHGVELETEVRYFSDDDADLNGPAGGGARGRVAVLAGGPSCEREISLISGKAVQEALKKQGYDAFLVDPMGDFVPALKERGVSMAFNAVHGTFGEDGRLQRILDEAGIPYTGEGPGPSEIAFDKSRAQEVFRKAGVPVPASQVLRGPYEKLEAAKYPVVVKPASSGSSVGVSIVKRPEDLHGAVKEAFRYSETVLLEEYVSGRELTVGILGGRALPVVEVIPGDKFYDYTAKYKSSETRYEFPARLTAEETRAVQEAALAAYRAAGCEVMGRVDVIFADGKPYVLEINTIPGLTGKSLLPKAAAASGIEFGELCVKIMELSERRLAARMAVSSGV